MSEKRKPVLVLFARKSGQRKLNKVELFDAKDFETDEWSIRNVQNKYRLRVNGKWYHSRRGDKKRDKTYLYKSQIKDLFWKSLPI